MADLIIDGKQFIAVAAGGDGNSLFMSLARALNQRCHYDLRRKLVNYVSQMWPEYRTWARYTLRIRSRADYCFLMSQPGVYGSELECLAATRCFNINLTIYRVYAENKYFCENFFAKHSFPTVYLLFSGMKNEVDEDGHFQLLKPIDDVLESRLGHKNRNGAIPEYFYGQA